MSTSGHDDAIIWNRFLHYWLFVREIDRSRWPWKIIAITWGMCWVKIFIGFIVMTINHAKAVVEICLKACYQWMHLFNNYMAAIDSFTVPLHSPNGRHLPAVRTVQRDCLKTVGISTSHVNPYDPRGSNGTLSNTNLYFDQPITKAWCQLVRGHGSYPNDSPIATRLGLCTLCVSS